MSAEDRDARFERALARHLREGAGCPDAEILAAYHERSLSLEEMAHWKQHIAGCAACQETLSLMEATEKQLAEDWKEKKIPVLEAAARETVATTRVARGADLGGIAAASAVSSAPVSIAKMKRPMLLRWAVPVGAVAAGVLVWIGIHERGTEPAHKSEAVQVAENRPQAPAAQNYSGATPKVEPPAERDKEASRLDGQLADQSGGHFERKSAAAAGDSLTKKDQAALAYRTAPEPRAAAGAIISAPVSAVPAAPPPPATPAPRAAMEQAPAAATETVEVASEAQPSGGAGKPVEFPGGQGGASAADDQKHVAAMSKSKSMTQQAGDVNTNAMMMKQGANRQNDGILVPHAESPVVILTPDNKVWWKLGTGGGVELTMDAGKKWKTVETGATAQLTAGSAPSSKVCWIAGQVGTLVLTTDRGRRWTKLTTPITADLGGVQAVDARHATIWAAGSRLSYQTSDGGVTWKQTANE